MKTQIFAVILATTYLYFTMESFYVFTLLGHTFVIEHNFYFILGTVLFSVLLISSILSFFRYTLLREGQKLLMTSIPSFLTSGVGFYNLYF